MGTILRLWKDEIRWKWEILRTPRAQIIAFLPRLDTHSIQTSACETAPVGTLPTLAAGIFSSLSLFNWGKTCRSTERKASDGGGCKKILWIVPCWGHKGTHSESARIPFARFRLFYERYSARHMICKQNRNVDDNKSKPRTRYCRS